MINVVSSRPCNGEDPSRDEQTTEASARTTGIVGHSTHAHPETKHGRPAQERAQWGASNGSFRSRPVQESEEPIVVMKPGNAGGAKGLWFGVRSNEAEGGGLA